MKNNNMYRIIGIIGDHYIVETPEGLRKVVACIGIGIDEYMDKLHH